MSAAGGLGEPAAVQASWLHQVGVNSRETLATLVRAPRAAVRWPGAMALATGTVLSIAAVLGAMYFIDGWAAHLARRLPEPLQAAASRFTDLGKSGWFLWPLGLLLLALAALDTPAMPRFPRRVLAAFSVRLGFVFTAIAVPGLFVTIVKRLIGRARPFVAGDDVWAYAPFGWHPAYASLPSGHAATAFSALVAIGAIFPQARALMWIYAIMIALSRIVVTAHYPSDVVAGAIVGAGGAWLVRNWFAARRLGFLVGPDASIRAMPGPGFHRIVKAVARRLHSA